MTTGTQWKVKLECLRGFCVFVRGKHGGDFEKRPKKIEASSEFSIFGGLADLIWHLLSHHKTLLFWCQNGYFSCRSWTFSARNTLGPETLKQWAK